MNNTLKYLDQFITHPIDASIILGSGLSSFIDSINNKIILDYSNIPNFLNTKVEGHHGQLVIGNINGVNIICANGRFHYYEGHSFDEIGLLIKIFKHYNSKICIITNSSGCLNLNWDLGSLMVANKFIDYSFINSNKPKTHNYKSNKYLNKLLKLAKHNNIKLNQGTYTFTTGPVYETAAEIKDIIKNGGNAVGMSTFPEFVNCEKINLDNIVISCLTNYGAGLINNEKIKHIDVLNNANKYKNDFNELLIKFIESM